MIKKELNLELHELVFEILKWMIFSRKGGRWRVKWMTAYICFLLWEIMNHSFSFMVRLTRETACTPIFYLLFFFKSWRLILFAICLIDQYWVLINVLMYVNFGLIKKRECWMFLVEWRNQHQWKINQLPCHLLSGKRFA